MINPWFKFYAGEYLSDPKIFQLNAQERSCWVTILCLANQSEDGTVKFLSEEHLQILSGVQGTLPGILEKFEKLKMIRNINGIVTVINWKKRQMSESYSRVQAFRKRQSNADVTDREEESREEENRIDKKVYSEFKNVKLTDEEHKKLTERLGERNTNILIEELGSYLASSRKKYLSHYATLLNWARRKLQDHQKSISVKPKRTIA